MKRGFFIFLFLALLLVVVGVGYYSYQSSRVAQATVAQTPPTLAVTRGTVKQSVTVVGQLVGTRQATLSFGVSGALGQLDAHPGERVQANQVLAQLNERALQYEIQTAQLNLVTAQANLKLRQTPATDAEVAAARAQVASALSSYNAAVNRYAHRDEQITIARANLERANLALQNAQAAYDQVAWRPEVGALPESAALQGATIEYQAALAAYNLAAAEINDSAVQAASHALAQARAQLGTLTAPPDPNEIAVAQAAVDSAQLALTQAQANLAQSKLTAPFDGILVAVNARAGGWINAGAPIFEISDPTQVEARGTLTQEDYPLAQIGQAAQLFFDALPGLDVQGRVTQIVPLREVGTTRPLYPIYIALDSSATGLAPGMTFDAQILIAEREDVLKLPRAVVRASSNDTTTVKVWDGVQVVDKEITIGLRGDTYLEIVSGLSEGEQVVTR